MNTPDTPDRLLGRLQLPFPPADLRARSLAAARTAMVRPAHRPDRWTRLWENRVARLAWAAAVAGLVLGHLALSLPRHRATTRSGTAVLLAGALPDVELAETAALPRLRSGRLPQLDPPIGPRPAAPAEPTAARRANHDT